MILNDSIFTQGKISGLPLEDNRIILFSRSRRDAPRRFSVEEISEFQLSERKFFRKQLNLQGRDQLVFLERLPKPYEMAVFWKLNGENSLFFVEVKEELRPLGKDFKETLRQAFSNPDLDKLIEITALNESSLVYLSQTAATATSERTYSRFATLTPYIGLGSNSLGFSLPGSLEEAKIQAMGTVLGINGEVYLTFKRTLSLNLGLAWSQLDAQQYLEYNWQGADYQTDAFVDMSWIQAPLTVRYYLDLNPNRIRLFAEAGLVYIQAFYSTSGIFQAEIEGNQVTSSSLPLELGETFTGSVFGLGGDKYLPNRKALVLGIRYLQASGANQGESLSGLNFYLGYKF
ncbi:outer membrane beta-barrel protein [Algoriphagus confluentis]